MSLRVAEPGDEARIEGFLAAYPGTSMFLRSNLAAHGLGPSDAPHATSYWLAEDASGIRGVFGATKGGYLLVQAGACGDADYRDWAAALIGRDLKGITGDPAQVRRALEVLILTNTAFARIESEPLYELSLAKLRDETAHMRRPRLQDEDLLTEWFLHYEEDTGLNADPALVKARAAETVAGNADVWLLEDAGQPRAMAGINARVHDVVQVGGVFVPRAARNAGLGRRVVAGMLRHEASQGTTCATLFANNRAAARAYEAIVSGMSVPITVPSSKTQRG